MGEAKITGASARIGSLGMFAGGDGTRKVELARLEMDDVEGTVGSVRYRARELVLDGLETRLGHVQTNADAASLVDATVQTTDGSLRLDIGQIGFPRGLAFTHETELFAPHASLEDARFVIEDVSRLFARRRDAEPGAGAEAEAEASAEAEEGAEDGGAEADGARPGDPGDGARPGDPGGAARPADPGDATSPADRGDADRSAGPMDYRFLDALHGQLNIDLIVDLTLPWIGRRRVTHYLRIPIHDGTIDFEELEKDVHWLEGAFLDLELVGDRLVLERDLPLVPFASKALMWWRLAPEDVPLAQYRRVHLRNLLNWEFPARRQGKPRSRSKVALHELGFSNCSLALETTAPATIELGTGALIQLGGDEQVGLSELSLAGDIRYNRDQPATPTSLAGRIGQLDATVIDLPLGPPKLSPKISIDRLHIGGLEKLELHFEGHRPRRLTGTISRMVATNLRILL